MSEEKTYAMGLEGLLGSQKEKIEEGHFSTGFSLRKGTRAQEGVTCLGLSEKIMCCISAYIVVKSW